MQKIFLMSMIFSVAFSQEPSAFSSGGSIDTKSEVKLINERLFNLSTKIDTLDESQEGLKSVFDGQIQRIQDIANKIHTIQNENNIAMTDIRNHVDSNFALQNENIENLKKSITALSEILAKNNAQLKEEIQNLKNDMHDLISGQTPKQEELVVSKNNQQDTNPLQNTQTEVIQDVKQDVNIINANSKKDLEGELTLDSKQEKNNENVNDKELLKQENVKFVAKNEKESPKEENKETKDDGKTKVLEALKNKDLALVFKEGEEYLNAKNYELANEYLQFAVKGHHKPARGNYLLGEIAFTQKHYQEAIYYYKVSATRYDKADYMPNLMLNSAKSFIEIKEKDNAKRFLETLIQLYPEAKEAEESKKILSNL